MRATSRGATKFARRCVTTYGTLQTMLAWADDRALPRSISSPGAGAKSGARSESNRSALRAGADEQSRRDRHQYDKPSQNNSAASGMGCHSPLAYANRAELHFTVDQDTRESAAQSRLHLNRIGGRTDLKIDLTPWKRRCGGRTRARRF
jgi:hypothetical protein